METNDLIVTMISWIAIIIAIVGTVIIPRSDKIKIARKAIRAEAKGCLPGGRTSCSIFLRHSCRNKYGNGG